MRIGGQNKLLRGQDFAFYSVCLKQTFLGTKKFGGHKKLGTMPLNTPWIRKVTSKNQQIRRLLTVEIVVLEHIFDSD